MWIKAPDVSKVKMIRALTVSQSPRVLTRGVNPVNLVVDQACQERQECRVRRVGKYPMLMSETQR